jgi:hypothetical protein
MAMPASGCIALRTCIVGINCSSIACAINGSAIGNSSLSSLSISVGKTVPHCMSEFYGYTPTVPQNVLNIFAVGETGDGITSKWNCGCLQPSVVVPATDCYFPNYCWRMTASNASSTSACVSVKCNNVEIFACSVSAAIYNCTGTWTTAARKVDYNDLIHIVTCIESGFGSDTGFASVGVTSITQGVGTYCLGSSMHQSSAIGQEIE